jgi:TatD DNase family protein
MTRMAVFYDTHAHLHFPDFAGDLPEVISRATAAGISRIITIGTDFESSRRSLELAEMYPEVFAVVGWHPSHVLEAPEDIRRGLRDLARHPKVVALGETGLDYYRLPSRKAPGSMTDEVYKARQAELFKQHLEVAAETGLNCVVHQRESFDDCLAQMAPFAGKVKGVFHCFAGSSSDLQRVLELGSIVSFTGILTFKNAAGIRESLAAVPDGKFMFETDCPYLAPVPYRGKRCEPAYVREIAAVAQETRQCSLEQLSEVTCAAADSFFARAGTTT